MRVLVTRPEPGASRTAARLATLGHEAVVVPLFAARRLEWEMPEAGDAVAFTSANGVRFGTGPGLPPSSTRPDRQAPPCYTVGAETAAAARTAGFADVRTGATDAAALFEMAARDGVRRLLHLAGRDRTDAQPPAGLTVIVRDVYVMDPLDARIPDADLALVYSARAAARLAELCGPARARLAAAAFSPAIATALGSGWRSVVVAAAPNEDALFAACGLTCEKLG